jgi:DNA mismatch repair protein MutL
LFIDLDPSQLDINVHPTKQEIKFEDEKIVYAFVQAAVKHALAQFSIAPSLDFSLNADIQQMEAISKPANEERLEAIASSNLFKTFTQKNQAHKIEGTSRSELKHWKDFYEPASQPLPSDIGSITENGKIDQELEYTGYSLLKQELKFRLLPDAALVQLHQTYIITPTFEGFLLLHQQQAHERILYERYSDAANGKQMPTQRSLFPSAIELSAADSVLMQELLPELKVLGYLIEPFGTNTYVIQGTPADILQGNEKIVIELLLEQYKHFASDIKFSKRERLIRCVAKQQAIKSGKVLAQKEMTVLAEELFRCKVPNVTPNGSPTYLEFKGDYLERMFGK